MSVSKGSVLVDEASVEDALGRLAEHLRVHAAMSDSVGDGEVFVTLHMSSGVARKLAGGVDQLRRRAAAHDGMAAQVDDVLEFRDLHARIDRDERDGLRLVLFCALSLLIAVLSRVFL